MTTFEQFGLKEELLLAIQQLGFTQPSPIQEKAIPHLVKFPFTDITALAQTGTGKTAAFGMPLLQHIDTDENSVQGLVLSPTRELCMQIQQEFEKYASRLADVNIVSVYGGTPISNQIRALRRNQLPQIIVATPGRLIDLIERGAVDIATVRTVVLDEADEMLNMGFRDDIDFILKNATSRKATWLFSATMNNDVRRIAKKYMDQPFEIAVAKENVTNENIDHQYFVTNAHQRYETLKRLLDFSPDIYGIIFTRTKQDAQDVSEKLMREGYQVSPLHGDMDQKMRTKVMERFKQKMLQAIVATDVAARGIDVNDITHVINYELPEDTESYTHRSGRTARAGKSGICMSIVTPREISKIRQIERIIKSRFIKNDIPAGTEIVRRRIFHFLDKIENATPEKDFVEIYKASIIDKLEAIGKEDLINRLLWLHVKDAISDYENASDLNVSATKEGRRSGGDDSGRSGGFVRLFINIGTKDGVDVEKLIQFVADMSDMERNLISRITVRETVSFFNVPETASEYVQSALSQHKYKHRKVRVEEADKKPAGGGGGNSSRPPRAGGSGDNYRKSYHDRGEFPKSGTTKSTRARKPNNKY